jgi:hypothetical protein
MEAQHAILWDDQTKILIMNEAVKSEQPLVDNLSQAKNKINIFLQEF